MPENTIDIEQLLGYFSNPFRNFVDNFSSHPTYIFEIVFLSFLIWRIYLRIKGTQVEQLLKGILVIIAALLISKAFNLEIISKVLENLVNVVLVGVVVIFQPELRRILGYLGQSSVFGKNSTVFDSEDSIKSLIYDVTEAVKHLKKTHTGALIVIEDSPISESYLEVGTPLDADVSVELILTIFHPNTPLHDGAIVISSNKIIAAGVLLPLTDDPKLSWQYGTRHRAAIGMSEVSNSTCVVVSEETGEVSIARKGILKKYSDIEEFRKTLEEIFGKYSSVKKKPEQLPQKPKETDMEPSDLTISPTKKKLT